MFRYSRRSFLWLLVGVLSCDTPIGRGATNNVNQGSSINVTTRTTGTDLDPDGYQVSVDADTRQFDINDFERFQNLQSGPHTVTLSGVAGNCTVANNPRQITSTATAVTSTTFDVGCVAIVSSLTVAVHTVGPTTDPDGYTVLAAGQTKLLASNGSVVFPSLPAGDYSVLLGDVEGCFVVLGTNPRTVTVQPQQAASTLFEVDCGGPNGTLEVTTSTTGIEPDLNGYIVNVDQLPLSIGSNSVQRLDQLPPGTYVLNLQGLAFNCSVQGANPRSVTIAAQALTQTTFDVACVQAQRIAFQSDGPGGFEIYTMFPDGTDLKQLTSNTIDDVDPDWSPDGTKIAFVRNGDIWVMNADGSNPQPVRVSAQGDDDPDWSPDGQRLLFESDAADGTREIFIMDATGNNVQQLTDAARDSGKPHFSPNGANIVFVSDRFGNDDVFTMLVNGALVVRLTFVGINYDAAWSSTGGQIVFASDRDGDGEIWVMGANGGNQTQKTFNTSSDGGPAWTADGTIAFHTERNGHFEVFLLTPTGQEVQRTNQAFNAGYPDWRKP